MNIKVITDSISLNELKELAKEYYITMIKGVVDIEKEIVAFGGEYHMDANVVLLEKGHQQGDIWGFNVVFDLDSEDWIEYTSLINIRPLKGNRSMEITDRQSVKRSK
ncbi:MAG: DUF5674 family protein [bacterium]